MIRTLRGSGPDPAGTLPVTSAIWRSTLRRQPSGWALMQMKPRERRLMTCSGMGIEADTLQRECGVVHWGGAIMHLNFLTAKASFAGMLLHTFLSFEYPLRRAGNVTIRPPTPLFFCKC